MWQDFIQFMTDTRGLAPLAYLMGTRPELWWLHCFSGLLTAASAAGLATALVRWQNTRNDLSDDATLLCNLGVVWLVLLAAGAVLGVALLWYPLTALTQVVRTFAALTLLLMLGSVIGLWKHLLALPGPQEVAKANQRLQGEILAHTRSMKELDRTQLALDDKVRERTESLQSIVERFENSLRGANVFVFSQDKNLRYTWVHAPPGQRPVEQIKGRTDFELMPGSTNGPLVGLKQKAFATGKPQEGDINYEWGNRQTWYRVHVEPMTDASGTVVGLNGVALDITAMKALEQEQIRLSAELATTLQRYQLAMRSSNVVVYTQDTQLRFTSISRSLQGRSPEEYMGKTDAEVLPADTCAVLLPLKQKVLKDGTPQNAEVPVTVDGKTLWYDMALNPLKDVGGQIIGLACAAVDVTERKGWEDHLHLLMRELTHRSKNLLAVIQAMARQTARHADNVEQFVDRFGARLQALAGSHDLLVERSWHGAKMKDLIISQLGHYADLIGSQISMGGPEVFLTPESAQNLGMAMHELATNAAKYGALSVNSGQVNVRWRWLTNGDGHRHLELRWEERGGPPVKAPSKTGFGMQVIERNVVRSLNAKVDLDYAESGLICTIGLPEHATSDNDDARDEDDITVLSTHAGSTAEARLQHAPHMPNQILKSVTKLKPAAAKSVAKKNPPTKRRA